MLCAQNFEDIEAILSNRDNLLKNFIHYKSDLKPIMEPSTWTGSSFDDDNSSENKSEDEEDDSV